jgi:hypothetical protein
MRRSLSGHASNVYGSVHNLPRAGVRVHRGSCDEPKVNHLLCQDRHLRALLPQLLIFPASLTIAIKVPIGFNPVIEC